LRIDARYPKGDIKYLFLVVLLYVIEVKSMLKLLKAESQTSHRVVNDLWNILHMYERSAILVRDFQRGCDFIITISLSSTKSDFFLLWGCCWTHMTIFCLYDPSFFSWFDQFMLCSFWPYWLIFEIEFFNFVAFNTSAKDGTYFYILTYFCRGVCGLIVCRV